MRITHMIGHHTSSKAILIKLFVYKNKLVLLKMLGEITRQGCLVFFILR